MRLDVGGASLVIALQRPAVLSSRTLRAAAVPLHQGPAGSVGGGEVIVALPLGLQTQLVPVVLDVRLLLQSQIHLSSVGRGGWWGEARAKEGGMNRKKKKGGER